MRKRYITPSIEVCRINGLTLLQSQSMPVGESVNDLSKAESFRPTLFDDDEEYTPGW